MKDLYAIIILVFGGLFVIWLLTKDEPFVDYNSVDILSIIAGASDKKKEYMSREAIQNMELDKLENDIETAIKTIKLL